MEEASLTVEDTIVTSGRKFLSEKTQQGRKQKLSKIPTVDVEPPFERGR